MKKSIVKTMLKAAATTTMAAAIFIGGSKMTVNADEIDDFAAMKGMTVEQLADACAVDFNLSEELVKYIYEVNGEDYYEATEYIASRVDAGDYSWLTEDTTATQSHSDMLGLVNKDRVKNGAGNLVWNADLEAAARQRAVEVMSNVQTEEFAIAYAAGDMTKINEIVHKGYTLKENAIVSWSSNVAAKTANNNWIASAGHHAQRIKAEWTQYACASYTDPITGMETWVEVFADNNFKGASTFDSIRYAADYPDLAAAFGNDKNALYNHYITNGRKEGRKAYNTDGTLFK